MPFDRLSYSSGLDFGLAADSDSLSLAFFLPLPVVDFSAFSPRSPAVVAVSLALVLPVALLAAPRLCVLLEPAAGEPDMLELDELMSLGLEVALLDGECVVLERGDVPVRGVADALVLLRIPAAVALAEAFGEALTVAEGEADAPIDGVMDVDTDADGEPLVAGLIDVDGVPVTLVEAPVLVVVLAPVPKVPPPPPMLMPTAGVTP